MALLKQSTAYVRTFFMVSSTDHIAAKTGAAPAVNISKAGGAFAAAGGAIAEISSGWYNITLNTTDTNTLGDLAYHVTGTGADDTDFVDQVSARIADDLAFPNVSGRGVDVDASGGVEITPNQSVNVAQWLTVAPNVLIAGRVDANAQVVGDKTGYSLTQAFPANFAALSITAGGLVDITQAAADKVWATAIRLLTAGTNIVLAKGVGVTGFNDLDAAGVRGAVGLAAANLDAQLDALPTAVENRVEMDANSVDLNTIVAGVSAIFARTDVATSTRAAPGDAMLLTSGAIDLIHDEAIDGLITHRELMRLLGAALGGKASGLDTGLPKYRDLADTKDRIDAVTDANGNRSTVTLDLT